MRKSARIQAKQERNDQSSITEDDKNQIKHILGADIPNVMEAFVRVIPEEMKSTVKMPQNDDTMFGIAELASLPDRNGKYEWTTYCVMHNEIGVVEADSYNMMNDDKEYKEHVTNILTSKFKDKKQFLTEYNKYGRDIDAEIAAAIKLGRGMGHKEAAEAETIQVLIYAANKLHGKLTEKAVQRKGEISCIEKLTLNSHQKAGHEIIREMALKYSKKGTLHIYDEIDWEQFAQKVGATVLAKQLSTNLFLYSDNLRIEYNEANHRFVLYFVGVRWTDKDKDSHRHRNIPALFD